MTDLTLKPVAAGSRSTAEEIRTTLTRIVIHPAFQLIALALLFAAPAFLKGATIQILAFALVSIIFAQSPGLLTGLAGQVSLGHAAFFGIGAYGSAILAKSVGLSLLLSIPLAALSGALVAWLLSFPAGRVREVYLAMMTLGFGQIFFEVAREWTSLTGGINGMSGVSSASLRSLVVLSAKLDAGDFFRALVMVTALVLIGVRNVAQSRVGRAMCAMHHSEFAAGSVGIARRPTWSATSGRTASASRVRSRCWWCRSSAAWRRAPGRSRARCSSPSCPNACKRLPTTSSSSTG